MIGPLLKITGNKKVAVFDVRLYDTLFTEFKIACGDMYSGLNWLISRACIRTFGNHMKISVNNKPAKLLTHEYLSRLCRLICINYCWHVYNEMCVGVNNVNKSVIV